MKIYFNMGKYEKHKFTKLNESIFVFSISFKNGIWIAFTERLVGDDKKTGILVNSETGEKTKGKYYDCFFYKKTFLRIKFKPFSKWKNSCIIIARMPEEAYNELKVNNE